MANGILMRSDCLPGKPRVLADEDSAKMDKDGTFPHELKHFISGDDEIRLTLLFKGGVSYVGKKHCLDVTADCCEVEYRINGVGRAVYVSQEHLDDAIDLVMKLIGLVKA